MAITLCFAVFSTNRPEYLARALASQRLLNLDGCVAELGTVQKSGAQFSAARTWRYALWRTWQEGEGHAMFIGLNPSTADETQDDPTVRKCMGFAKRWGYGGIYMLNLFAYRSTDPRALLHVEDPVGPQNNEHLAMYARSAGIVVAAWGAFKIAEKRGEFVDGLLRAQGANTANRLWHLRCLGVAKSGAPRHPLYVPYSQMHVSWRA